MNSLYKHMTTVCKGGLRNLAKGPQTSQVFIPSRNTFILQRRHPIKLQKKGRDSYGRLKANNYIYDLVKNVDSSKKPPVSVILKQFVEGVGNKGEVITLNRSTAYNDFLVTGLADYATEEAIESSKRCLVETKDDKFSSRSAPQTVKFLQSHMLPVVMNKDTQWTLEPWHIRVAFRKSGVHVPTDCIKLPDKPIEGPNLDYENKMFFVTVTINNKETALVRCRIHHWSTDIAERLECERNAWALPPEPLFSEDSEKIKNLTEIEFKSISVRK